MPAQTSYDRGPKGETKGQEVIGPGWSRFASPLVAALSVAKKLPAQAAVVLLRVAKGEDAMRRLDAKMPADWVSKVSE